MGGMEIFFSFWNVLITHIGGKIIHENTFCRPFNQNPIAWGTAWADVYFVWDNV